MKGINSHQIVELLLAFPFGFGRMLQNLFPFPKYSASSKVSCKIKRVRFDLLQTSSDELRYEGIGISYWQRLIKSFRKESRRHDSYDRHHSNCIPWRTHIKFGLKINSCIKAVFTNHAERYKARLHLPSIQC